MPIETEEELAELVAEEGPFLESERERFIEFFLNRFSLPESESYVIEWIDRVASKGHRGVADDKTKEALIEVGLW